jgi:hypothetical protein
MFPFGHAGLAVGLVVALAILLKKPFWLANIDMRLVVVLSMLPDIIDKPLGHFILGEDLNNGRIFAHTLVFVILTAVLFALIFKKMFWIYVLPVLLHQVLDFMWEIPRTWFWPLFGFGFKSYDYNVWEHWLKALFTDPYVITGEISGLVILLTVFFAFGMYRKENFLRGLKRGRLLE